jgi:hypothetical protein
MEKVTFEKGNENIPFCKKKRRGHSRAFWNEIPHVAEGYYL